MANNGTAPDLQAIRDEITRIYNSTEDYTQQANMQPYNSGMTRDQIASIYYDGAVPSANDIPVLQPMNQQPIQAQTPTQKQNTHTTTQKPQKDVGMEMAKEIGKQALKDAKSSVYGQGNIDLHNRPKYRQNDGSISTVNSMSFQDEDGKEVLIPTIAYDKNGKPTQLTDDEAIDRYYQTGEYLGKFNTVDEADKYAQKLHKDQEDYYLNGGNKRSLSANEQRDMERAMNARKEAEDRRKKTVTETVKTEEQLSGKMPSEITSGTVNKESEYDDRGFRKNKAIFNEFLDPNKKLSQQEQQQAWDMINKYEQSENGAKNENATTLVFDEEHPDGISVPVYTVDENGNYDPSKELSQSDKDYRKNIYDLKAKVSNADATYNGLASGLVPFYEAGMRLTDYDGEWQKAQENSAKQNPLAYNASRLMGGLAASLTGQAALRGTKYADALGKLIGEGGVAKEILKDALSDMPIDLAVDILPSIAADIAAGKDANEVIKSALANIGLNAGLNTGAAVIGNAGDILTSLRPKSVLDDTLKNLEGADLFAEMANRGRNVEAPAEGIDYFAQMASAKRVSDDIPKLMAKSDAQIQSEKRIVSDQLNKLANGDMFQRDFVELGNTPQYMDEYGNSSNPLVMKQNTVNKVVYPEGYMGGKHNLGYDSITELPEQLNNPVLVMRSKTQPNSGVVLTDMIDADGNPVSVPIHMDKKAGDRIVNEVASMQGRPNTENLINSSEILFKNEERANDALLGNGLRLSEREAISDPIFNYNVNQLDESVNPQSVTPGSVNEIPRVNEGSVNVYDISDEFAPMGDIPRLEESNVSPMNGGGSGNSIVPRDISRVDEPRGKVSQFATNTMKEGTNLTPEEYARNVDLADFTYENKSERQSMEDAFNMIREEGANNLKARLLSDDAKDLTQSEIDALMSITRTNNATARAMEAVGEDASAIRAETTAIYKKLRQQSTSNAQGLQALAKWTRNTPEGLLMHAENIVNGNTEAKGSALQEALKKLKKSRKDIDFSPEFEKNFLEEAEKLEDIGDMDSREAKDIMAKLGRMVNDEIPVKLNEKVQSFLMDNMLGNFRTLITRNAGGNLGLAGVEQVATRPLAAGIDKAVSKVTGKRTQAGLSRDGIVEYLSGFRKGLSDEMHDVNTGLHTARTGENTLENAIRSNRHVFKNKVQDKFDSLVKNGLSVGDRPFYEANYKQTLGDYYRLRNQGVMGNAVQNLSDDEFKMYAETAAKLNALASVYQNDSKISDALLGFKNAIGEFSEGTVGFDILSQFSMPFVKTPANVVDRAIDYSPLGIVRNIARTAKEGGLKGENFDQNRFVNETARNIIGTTLMGGAAAGAANGVMSGSYSDKNNVKQAQKDSGMQEYALNIPGGKQMDISWLPVVGSNAVAAAAAVDAYKDGDGNAAENLMKGLTAGGEALFDQSMFQGLQRLFGSGETYNSDSTLPENMINVVKSGFGQAIPSLVRQGAQVADRYQRDLGNSNKDLSFGIMGNYDINSLVNNIPGLRQNTLAPKVDLSGNLIEENQGRGLGSKILENMILPGKITDINVNPLDEEAIRLEEAGYDKAYRPKASRSTIDKGETPLTNEEWVSYEQRFGQEITNAGNAIINSDLYKNANDETKNSILNTSYDAIKNGINSEYTGSKVTGAAKAYVDAGGGEAGINAVLEYVEAKNNPYGISADAYSKMAESGEDLSQFNGYKEALEQYNLNDSEKLREAWKSETFDDEAQFKVTMNEQGLGDYDSKSAHDAYESKDFDKYKEYREYLKKKELSDTESRWSDFKKGKIDTTASLNSDIDWNSYGITNKYADEGYAKAKHEIPKLSPQLYVQTYKAIDANGNNKFTQDEVINYLNRINADEAAAMQIWNGYGTSTWEKIPVLENGKWVKKSK